MDPNLIIQGLMQVLGAIITLTPKVIEAVEDYKKLFADGGQPTQADFDALVAKIKSQSEAIQAQPD